LESLKARAEGKRLTDTAKRSTVFVIRDAEADGPTTAGAIALSKRFQSQLGMYPFGAFQESARNGELLVATSGETVIGYVLFARQRRAVSLIHLCVDPDARSGGIARALVSSIVERNRTAPGIKLRCRTDYPADAMWPRLGFQHRGERPGRSKSGAPLADWWMPVSDHTLLDFDALLETNRAAAIDVNVLRDIMEPRAEHEDSLALMSDWLADHFELVVTGEVHNELARLRRSAGHAPSTAQFRDLNVGTPLWEPLFNRLRSELGSPAIGESDLRLLAQAGAGKATYFVTRDEGVLKHKSSLRSMTGLDVLRPVDLLLQAHADDNRTTYEPKALLDTGLRLVRLSNVPNRASLAKLVPKSTSESARDLHDTIVTALTGTHKLVDDANGIWAIERSGEIAVLAVVTVLGVGGEWAVPILRTRNDRDSLTLTRQLLHAIRERASLAGAQKLSAAMPADDFIRQALDYEGFVRCGEGWTAQCASGHLSSTADCWPTAERPDLTTMRPENVSDLEKRFWPAKLFPGTVPTYIVPIKPAWARELFDHSPAQGSLFRRADGLGIAREHSYYRAAVGKLEAPARIMWWVSGGKVNSGLRAHSWLDAVDVDRPLTLYRRYGRRGIYQSSDLFEAAGTRGRAMALLFSRTELYRQPFTLPDATSIYSQFGQNGFLQTVAKVDEHVFEAFYLEDLRRAETRVER
jgi:GNAT superfamily N-acetyltransferase